MEYCVVLDCEKGCVSSNRNNHDLKSRIISLDRRLGGERGVEFDFICRGEGRDAA